MGQVTISGTTFDIYGTHAGAAAYLAGSLNGGPWLAATTTLQDQALVTATRTLDALPWAGTKTDPGQPLAWPRTGVVDATGTAVDANTIPQAVINACYELAAALVVNANVTSSQNKVKSFHTNSTWMEFFASRQTTGIQLPDYVRALVAEFMGSGRPIQAVPVVSGTDVESQFDDDDRFYLNGPL